MERIVKIFFIIIMLSAPAWADIPAQQLTTPASISFETCIRTYNLPAEKLYYLALNSITANNFETKEMQSKMGYILFKAAGREFLATVGYYGNNKSIIRITPANNVYYFAPGIVLNIFKYIDVYMDEPINVIPKT